MRAKVVLAWEFKAMARVGRSLQGALEKPHHPQHSAHCDQREQRLPLLVL